MRDFSLIRHPDGRTILVPSELLPPPRQEYYPPPAHYPRHVQQYDQEIAYPQPRQVRPRQRRRRRTPIRRTFKICSGLVIGGFILTVVHPVVCLGCWGLAIWYGFASLLGSDEE